MENKEIDILLIEDNPNDAELTMRALRKKETNLNVNWLKDGEQAIDFLFSNKNVNLSKQNPRLILLDLKLPKISGIEVLKKIKEDSFLKSTPVVVFTSSNEEKDRIECYKNFVNSYIVKPVDFTKFIDTVVNIGLYWLNINQPLK